MFIIMCGMSLRNYSQTSMVAPLKFGNKYLISPHTLQDVWLLIHAGIEVNPY